MDHADRLDLLDSVPDEGEEPMDYSPTQGKLEKRLADMPTEVHSKRVRERLRRGLVGQALQEAKGVVAALERLYEDVKDEAGPPA